MRFNGKNSNAFNYIAEQYQFRFNVVTNFYEYRRRKKGKNWKKYDDRKKNDILLELISEHIEVPTEKVNIFLESQEFSPDYNPFKRYFKEIKPWDGKTDYIGKIAKTVKTEDAAKFRQVFERFLIGTLDCLLKPDKVNDVCLVFQSPQGVGKTRWMRALLPKRFQEEYLYEGNIDTKNKDHTMYLSQYWFIHLDELETLRSNDISAIKSYITRQRISVRKAYGRYKTNFVRRASFLGSVNEDKFLSDITGNRRWLVFKVSSIDYLHKINPDDVWAQAHHLYNKGQRHWFNLKEIKKINKSNERFRTISLEEELLLRYFVFKKKGKAGEMLSGSEIIQKVIHNVPGFNHKLSSIPMGKALSKHSKHKKMQGGVQKYFVHYLGAPIITESPSPATNSGGSTIEEGDDLPF